MILSKSAKNCLFLIMFIIFMLLFSGCAAENSALTVSEPELTAEEALNAPEPSEAPPIEIQIGTYSFLTTDEKLDLTDKNIDFSDLCDSAEIFKNLKS